MERESVLVEVTERGLDYRQSESVWALGKQAGENLKSVSTGGRREGLGSGFISLPQGPTVERIHLGKDQCLGFYLGPATEAGWISPQGWPCHWVTLASSPGTVPSLGKDRCCQRVPLPHPLLPGHAVWGLSFSISYSVLMPLDYEDTVT